MPFLVKRGRPEFLDRSTIKSRAMTIVLTEDTLAKLDQLATVQKRKKATLARIMIEQQVENSRVN
jgi:predicted transcriptional regulator